MGADMQDESAWGGAGEGARRGGRGSERSCENQGSCPAALGEGGGREDGPAATRPLPRRRGDGDTWQAGKEVCAGGERGNCVADTLK